jgi:predicted esterase
MRLIADGKAQVDEIVIWSGDVPRDLHFSDFKKRSSGSRNWFLVGDSDEIVHADIYAESENLYMRHGIPYEKIKFNGGHEIPAETLLSLQERIGR